MKRLRKVRMFFLLQCEVAVGRTQRMAELRPPHLDYVGQNRSVIRFGGICAAEGEPPSRICYVVDVPSSEDALEFIEGDPYYEIYDSTEVLPFQLRIAGEAPAVSC